MRTQIAVQPLIRWPCADALNVTPANQDRVTAATLVCGNENAWRYSTFGLRRTDFQIRPIGRTDLEIRPAEGGRQDSVKNIGFQQRMIGRGQQPGVAVRWPAFFFDP